MKAVLSIAGSDSSGGAGIQADLKTMTVHGVFGMTAITALTAQNTTGVTAIQESSPEFLEQQIDACLSDIPADAVKIGMLPSAEQVEVVAKKLREYTEDIRNNKKQFIQSSFAELFTSPAKRIQIFFADFWGMNKTYNRPGTDTGNWLLRVNNDFENNYYQAVKEGKAPNLAKIIAIALRHKGLDKGNEQLMKDLDESAKILNE